MLSSYNFFFLCVLKGGLLYVQEQANFLFRTGSVAKLRIIAISVVIRKFYVVKFHIFPPLPVCLCFARCYGGCVSVSRGDTSAWKLN
jgi:hypothetical protein